VRDSDVDAVVSLDEIQGKIELDKLVIVCELKLSVPWCNLNTPSPPWLYSAFCLATNAPA
jgi:hypothetical protein